MNPRWMLPALITTFCVLTLGILYSVRKPLCIDSKVVDRIDRGSESVFKCSANRRVPFSTYFDKNLPFLAARIQHLDHFLETLTPFKNRLRLVIVAEKPDYFLVTKNALYIGEDLLQAEGHLEKALAKFWYRENVQHLFAYETLFEEVYTDFLLYLANGRLSIQDPVRNVRTRVGGGRWPQVLKSAQAYCQSPWKISEHYSFCALMQKQESAFQNQIVELSLRPMLVSSWIKSYQDLSFRDQYQMIRNLRDLLTRDHIPDLPLVRTGGLGPQSSPLLEASEAVKNISNFLMSSQLSQTSSSHRVFVSLVANQLRQFGYKDALGGVHFDLLVVSENKLSPESEQFRHFITLSKKNPGIKMAVKDPDSLWMLPSLYPIQWPTLNALQANRIVYGKCGNYDFDFVWQFAGLTEKLMILNVCKGRKFNLAGYLQAGAEGFGEQNKDISFIQFHVPSLLMRKDQLAGAGDVYQLVSRRELENPAFRSLGWQKLLWSEKAQAYQPKSFIDGIEWFKVQ